MNLYLNKVLKTENIDWVVAIDTDSVAENSEIFVENKKIEIGRFFDECDGEWLVNDEFNEKYVRKVENKKTYSVGKNGNLNQNSILYVMKHKVKKKMYRVKIKDKFVDITEDHSLIVRDKVTEEITEIKPASVSVKRHQIINIIDGNDTDRREINEVFSKCSKMD